jgi:hypothetical protein
MFVVVIAWNGLEMLGVAWYCDDEADAGRAPAVRDASV